MPGIGFFQGASHTIADHGHFNDVNGDQITATFTTNNWYKPSTEESTTLPSGFNDAPVNHLASPFIGRANELGRIKEILDATHKDSDSPACCVVYGMHGLGKTQLALQYAKLAFLQKRYTYIFWVSSTSIEKLNQGFSKILDLVAHRERHRSEQEAKLTAARRWLEDTASVTWLIVFDNVARGTIEFLREHIPRKNSQGRILYITRAEDVAKTVSNSTSQRNSILELRVPDSEDATKLLFDAEIDATDVSSSALAKQLVDTLGRLPLAIFQAAAFMKQSQQSIVQLLQIYKNVDLKSQIIHWENDLSIYEQRSVAATFTSQIELLSPEAGNFLKLLSFLDPENIPVHILIEGAKKMLEKSPQSDDATPHSSDRDSKSLTPSLKWFRRWSQLSHNSSLTKAQAESSSESSKMEPVLQSLAISICSHPERLKLVQQLQNVSLAQLQNNSKTPTLQIHDLIRLTVRESAKRDGTAGVWFDGAVEMICGAFQNIETFRSPQYWARCELFIPHVHSLTDSEITCGKRAQLARANVDMSQYLESRGRYKEAEKLLRWVLIDKEKRLGLENVETLSVVHKLAGISLLQGHYKDAEMLYERALAGREQVLGTKHRKTLVTVHNLAWLYELQGRYSDAEGLHRRALKGLEKELGDGHPTTLSAVHNLAWCCELQGRHDEAEKLCLRALKGKENCHGAEDIRTLSTVNNLAGIYQSQKQYDKAESLYHRALAGEEKQLGPQHPSTLTTMHNLATFYRSQRRYSEAEVLFKRTLVGREKQLKPEHPNTLLTVYGLAMTQEAQGLKIEAEVSYRRAFVGAEKQLGLEHPHTVAISESFAGFLRAT